MNSKNSTDDSDSSTPIMGASSGEASGGGLLAPSDKARTTYTISTAATANSKLPVGNVNETPTAQVGMMTAVIGAIDTIVLHPLQELLLP